MSLTDKQVDSLRILSCRPYLLWGNIDYMGKCWNWAGSKNKYGYGSVRVGPSSVLAHRAAFFLSLGAINGDCVCHKCDNPACCNPEHLFLSSHSGNMLDMKKKGRRKGVNTGTMNGRAKLTHQIASEIKFKRALGASLKELAEDYKVGMSTISRTCKGVSWS